MPDGDPQPQPDPDRRLAEVDRQVRDALRHRREAEALARSRQVTAQGAQAMGVAWRIMIDLVAATAVGAAIGFGVDALTGLSPLGLLGGLFFGFACGMWMVVRLARRIQAAAPGRSADAGSQPGEERS